MDLPWRARGGDPGISARIRLIASAAFGAVVGAATGVALRDWQEGLLLGWIAASGAYVAWLWLAIWPMDERSTRAHATYEDAGRAAIDVIAVVAAVVSLGAVGLLLVQGASGGVAADAHAALSFAGVGLAWATVHTVYTTRYARLYYDGGPGGVDFNQPSQPRYADFAYLSFTIGMTFQVSDTTLTSPDVRATALRHALLSYLFGVVVIAITINLVAGLAR